MTAISIPLCGCAALWVADKAADTAWFATKTTAKVGMATAELTWDAGSAAVGAASGADNEAGAGKTEKEKQSEAGKTTDD